MATFDFFTPLSQIGTSFGKSYDDARRQTTLADIGKNVSGANPDYGAAAAQALSAGDASTGLTLLQLGEQARLRKATEAGDAGAFNLLLGGLGGAAPPAGGAPSASPMAAPRPRVASLPTQAAPPAMSQPSPLPFKVDPSNPGPAHGLNDPTQYDRLSAGLARRSALLANAPDQPGQFPTLAEAGPPLPPARPTDLASAQPAPDADAPAADAAPAQFVVPGTGQSIVASSATPKLINLMKAAQLAKGPEARSTINAMLQSELSRIQSETTEQRKQAAEDARGPASVQEWKWARANGFTEAKSPAAYEAEKKDKDKGFTLAQGARRFDENGKLIVENPKDKDPTEGQSSANLYVRRMEEANQILSDPAIAAASKGTIDRGLSRVSGVGNYLVSENFQKADQAQRDFINSVLRRESGAAIASSEFENANKQYFPQPGDGAAVLAQKARNRQTAIDGIRAAAGPAYAKAAAAQAAQPQATPPVPTQPVAQPKAPVKPPLTPGAVEKGYRYMGGDPANPRSWAPVT